MVSLLQTDGQRLTSIADVATGSNGDDCCPGFRCAAGWDPVTGLGVTMFEELRDAVLAYLDVSNVTKN